MTETVPKDPDHFGGSRSEVFSADPEPKIANLKTNKRPSRETRITFQNKMTFATPEENKCI